MEITSIVSVDRRKIANGKQGEMTSELKKLYMTITKGKNQKYADYCIPVY